MINSRSFYVGSLFSLTIGLVLLGLIMVLSSSKFMMYASDHNNVYQYMGKQLIWFSLGLAALFFFSYKDYNVWERWARPLFWLSIIFLIIVLTPLGIRVHGSQRWLELFGFRFQPSDFAKLTIIFYLAAVWADRKDLLHSFKDGVLFPMSLVGLSLLLILLEPDNGTTFFIGVMAMVIWFSAGGRLLHLIPVFILMIVGIFVAIYLKPALYQRIDAFLNPEAYKTSTYYQVYNSLYGFAHGGLWGVGIGDGVQQLGFTPFPHTDFIFSTMGEELGFVKCTVVLMMYLGLIVLGYTVAMHCGNPFGKLLAVGCTTAIGFQSIINIAVVTGSIPTTGISLPFISYGGSSLLISMSLIGLLINIAKETYGIDARPQRHSKRRRG